MASEEAASPASPPVGPADAEHAAEDVAASVTGTKRRRGKSRSRRTVRARRRRTTADAAAESAELGGGAFAAQSLADSSAARPWDARGVHDSRAFDAEATDSGPEVLAPGGAGPSRGVPAATANFFRYYASQNLFPPGPEWRAFASSLRKPLPVSFRVSAHSPHLDSCIESGMRFLSNTRTFRSGRETVEPPRRLAWAGAWQLGCSSNTLRSAEEPHLKSLRRWLARYSALGAVTRQEVVSMIPVAFLDVQPGHHVLDMCAAPGSKTTQVLDILQGGGGGGGGKPAPGASTAAGAAATHGGKDGGLVVANDLDPSRGYMLVRRCTAMGLACARLVVTQHKAQKFPNVALRQPTSAGAGAGAGSGSGAPQTSTQEQGGHDCVGVYDRIVCDVPCCGDGTLRKSPSLWTRWHPEFALGLHSLQVQIAMRGAALLKVGGRMVYSTCTFNPVENEAVVCEILRRCAGALSIVDVSEEHPELRRAPGLKRWCVFDDAMTRFDTFESTQASHIPHAHRRRFRRSMFPTQLGSTTASGRLPPLRRCMRFYPHMQDTGGFFVCVFTKTRPLPPGVRPDANKHKHAAGPAPAWLPRDVGGASFTPGVAEAATKPALPMYRFLPPAPSALAWLRSHFGVKKSVLRDLAPRLFSRSNADGRYVVWVVGLLRTRIHRTWHPSTICCLHP